MRPSPITSMPTRRFGRPVHRMLGGVLATVVATIAVVGFLAAPAGAHHGDLVGVSARCASPAQVNAVDVQWTAMSWTIGNAAINHSVQVEYQVNDTGPWAVAGTTFEFFTSLEVRNDPSATDETIDQLTRTTLISHDSAIDTLKMRLRTNTRWGADEDLGRAATWDEQYVDLAAATDCAPAEVECSAGETPTDTDADEVDDTCLPVECGDEEDAVDTDDNGVADTCEQPTQTTTTEPVATTVPVATTAPVTTTTVPVTTTTVPVATTSAVTTVAVTTTTVVPAVAETEVLKSTVTGVPQPTVADDEVVASTETLPVTGSTTVLLTAAAAMLLLGGVAFVLIGKDVAEY